MTADSALIEFALQAEASPRGASVDRPQIAIYVGRLPSKRSKGIPIQADDPIHGNIPSISPLLRKCRASTLSHCTTRMTPEECDGLVSVR